MDSAIMGNIITSHRKLKGWTQKQLAAQLNVTDKAVSKWERGLNFPDIAILEDLATALELTVPQLLNLKEDATMNETLSIFKTISKNEVHRLKTEIRIRSILSVVILACLFFGQIYVSFRLDQVQMHGLVQILTMGTLPWIGFLIGNTLFLIQKLRKEGVN